MVAISPTKTGVREGKERASPSGETPSLKFRLIAVSLAWLALSLLATGVVLVLLFRAHVQRHFDQTLQGHLEELAAAASIGADGSLDLSWEPAEPRFRKALSGWYWEVRTGQSLKRSHSLMGQDIPPLPTQPAALTIFDNIHGPGDVRLRIAAEDFPEPGSGGRMLSVRVAGPCVTVQDDVFIFIGQLAAALMTLGLALGALIAVQLTYGLHPLAAMRAKLMDLRQGRGARLEADGPSEIAPLVEELNGLLEERDAMVAQARAEAGNLAHALKTPLAVIRNEAGSLPGEQDIVLKAEADKMTRAVEHHLLNARAQMKQRSRPEKALLNRVMEDVRFSLARLYPERRLEIRLQPALAAACAEDDLGEMIGNLADNACKWAARTVRISAWPSGARILIQVDDDGPGLSDDQREEVLARGKRLDESMPGHGLGLSIAAKLAALQGGALTLRRSELGGLAAILDLPSAAMRPYQRSAGREPFKQAIVFAPCA
jgi:signal transduction histidine kinase